MHCSAFAAIRILWDFKSVSDVIREIVARLRSKHANEMSSRLPSAEREFEPIKSLYSQAEFVGWTVEGSLSASELLNELGFAIAVGFYRNELDFDFCDRVANDLFATMNSLCPGGTDLLMSVFLAFDSGEYYHDENHSIHPVDRFTRPRIAEIVEERMPKV